MKPDGTMARMPELERFSIEHGIKLITVEQLIAYRRRNEKLIAKRVEATIPIGDQEPRIWKLYAYADILRHENPPPLVLGAVASAKPILLPPHPDCPTATPFATLRAASAAHLPPPPH